MPLLLLYMTVLKHIRTTFFSKLIVFNHYSQNRSLCILVVFLLDIYFNHLVRKSLHLQYTLSFLSPFILHVKYEKQHCVMEQLQVWSQISIGSNLSSIL